MWHLSQYLWYVSPYLWQYHVYGIFHNVCAICHNIGRFFHNVLHHVSQCRMPFCFVITMLLIVSGEAVTISISDMMKGNRVKNCVLNGYL